MTRTKVTKKTNRKRISCSINVNLYQEIQILALELGAEQKQKVNANDLLEEGMELLLKKYGKKSEVDKETL